MGSSRFAYLLHVCFPIGGAGDDGGDPVQVLKAMGAELKGLGEVWAAVGEARKAPNFHSI